MIIVPGVDPGAATGVRSDTFTGQVFSHNVLSGPGVRVASVTFTPRSRTFWHHHENGQLLYVTSGIGRVGTAGGSVHTIRAGDLIWTEPGESHWHGAGPDTLMSHLAISLGQTNWAEEVDDPDGAATSHSPMTTLSE